MNYFKKLMFIFMVGIGSFVAFVEHASADGVPNVTAGEPNKPRMDLVDVSSWNKVISIADFQKMKSYGVRGVIVKVTEGTYYISPVAQAQIDNARAAGMIISVYHYAKYQSVQEANQEADYFAAQVKKLGLPASTVLADDLEDAQTQVGDVTAHAQAFRHRLQALGYQRQMLYTAPYYISQTKLDINSFGNRDIWMASYPYTPSSDHLWHQQYGAWQWNSNTNFPGVTGVFDVSIDYGSKFLENPSSSVVPVDTNLNHDQSVQKPKPTKYQGYVNDGTGWYWYENGQRFTGFRYYMGTYYWFTNGVRQENQWQTAWGHKYYVGGDGRAVQGLQIINNKQYYFGKNGTYYLRTNQTLKIAGQIYLADTNGVLTLGKQPRQGYLATSNGWRWFEKDKLFTGFRFHMGAYYWFTNGVRQENQWQTAWGHKYYVGGDGRAVQGKHKINGRIYNFGNDGTYYLR